MYTLRYFFGDKEPLTDSYAIRTQVFIKEQNVPKDEEYDGTDGACVHIVAYDNEAPVATGRLMIDDEFTIGRVAVLPQYRGQKIGQGIVQALIQAATIMGAEKQVLHAQVSARGFYEKLGFTAFGEEFYEAGIKHIAMEHYGGVQCNAT